MRKMLLLMAIIVPIVTFAQRKAFVEKITNACLISPYYSELHAYENDSVSVVFNFSRYFIEVEVFNKTDNRIYIEWENARLDDSKVVFDDDRPITMGLKKEEEVVASRRSSESRKITKKSKFIGDTLYELINLKKYESIDFDVLLPIRFGDKSVDYQFKLCVYKYNKEQVDSIFEITKIEYSNYRKVKKGMSYEDVIKIMGNPKHNYGEVGDKEIVIEYNMFGFVFKDMKLSKKDDFLYSK